MTQTHPDSGAPNARSPVAALLVPRHLSHIEAINKRDWETLAGYQWHVAQDFTAHIMYSESVKSWADYADAFRNMIATTSPDFHIGVSDISVTVRDHLGKAEVYLLATEEGRVPGVVSHGMSKLEWRKGAVEGGKFEWFLCSHTMFRGVTEGCGL